MIALLSILFLSQFINLGHAHLQRLELVGITDTNLTFNFDVNLASYASYCIDLPAVQRVSSVNPTITLNMLYSGLNLFLTNLQLSFFPNNQYFGVLEDISGVLNRESSLGTWPRALQNHSINNCTSEIQIEIPGLISSFSQLCFTNICTGRSSCSSNNTWNGQLKLTGFTSEGDLSKTPINPQCLLEDSRNGLIEFVAKENRSLYFDYQVELGWKQKNCIAINPTTLLPNVNYGVMVNMTFGTDQAMDCFALVFQYPGGTRYFIGANAQSAYGTSIGTWPNNTWGDNHTPSDDIVASTKCYTAYLEASGLAPGFNEICIAVNENYASIHSNYLYSGRVRLLGYDTTSQPIQGGSQIHQICVPDLARNAFTFYNNDLHDDITAQQGEVAVIVLVCVFATVLLIFLGLAAVEYYRSPHKGHRHVYEVTLHEMPAEEPVDV